MNTDERPSVDALIDEAARWHARLDSGSARPDEFERWRNSDPRHAAAYARVLGTAGVISGLKTPLQSRFSSPSRRTFFKGGAAASVFVAVAGGAFLLSGRGRVGAQTHIGEQLTRGLPDGSQLHVNTDTKVQWRIDNRHRDVWLEKGEIALTVPKDARPLNIHVGKQVVELHAGQFNARVRNGALDLLVLDGIANLRGAASRVGTEVNQRGVSPGQAILASSEGIRMRHMTSDDVLFVTSWQRGEIFFNGETLGTVVEEFNRYLPKKIIIGDPSLQGIRLGGRFNSHDPQAFLSALHGSFGINTSRTADGSIVLTR